MQKLFGTILDDKGNGLAGVSVEVRYASTSSLYPIYATNSQHASQALANPVTTNSVGEYEYYAPNGELDERKYGGGIVTEISTRILAQDWRDETTSINSVDGLSLTGIASGDLWQFVGSSFIPKNLGEITGDAFVRVSSTSAVGFVALIGNQDVGDAALSVTQQRSGYIAEFRQGSASGGVGSVVGYVDVHGGAFFGGSVVVSGNLTVHGSHTQINVTDLDVTDNIITLNNSETGAGVTAGLAGLDVDRGSSTDGRLAWDETSDRWQAGLVGALQTLALLEASETVTGSWTFSKALVLSTAGTATTHAVRADRTLTAGAGLTGGGNLTANRTLAVGAGTGITVNADDVAFDTAYGDGRYGQLAAVNTWTANQLLYDSELQVSAIDPLITLNDRNNGGLGNTAVTGLLRWTNVNTRIAQIGRENGSAVFVLRTYENQPLIISPNSINGPTFQPSGTLSNLVDPINDQDAATKAWTLANVGSGGGVTDHGALTGLGDDDHTQYTLADGSRAMSALLVTGVSSLAGLNVSSAGTIRSLTVTQVGSLQRLNVSSQGVLNTLNVTGVSSFGGDTRVSSKLMLSSAANSVYLDASAGFLNVQVKGTSPAVFTSSHTLIRHNSNTKLATKSDGVQITGECLATTFDTSSSRRYKRRIRRLSEEALDVDAIFAGLEVKRGEFREDFPGRLPGRHLFPIAEEVSAVWSHAVRYDERGRPDRVDQSELLYLTMEKLRRETARADDLEERLSALEAWLNV